MKYRKLGSSDLEVSVLSLGALHFGVFCDLESTKQIVHKSLDLGINFIDTAPLYGNGNSEKFINKSIKGHREKFIFLLYLISAVHSFVILQDYIDNLNGQEEHENNFCQD